MKHDIFKIKATVQIWFYVSNSVIGALSKYLFLHRREHWVNLLEHITAEAYGVRIMALQISEKLAI